MNHIRYNRGKNFVVALTALLAVFAIIVSGCSPLVEPTAKSLPEVTFISTEYAYQGPESIPGGWTRLTLDNQGQLPHDLMLLKLAEDKTADDVMAALESEGPPEWAEFYGNVSAQPGQRESYIVELTPGNYVLLSFGQAEEGPPDAVQGMIATLTVTEAQGEVAATDLPQADAEVGMLDFAFAIKGDIKAGEQTLLVTNPGKELHEVAIYRLKDDTTMADFQAMLDKAMSGEEPQGEPIFEQVGVTLNSPGVSTYVTLDFESGNHVFVCHIPSPANEMQPHFALGMIQEVVVP